MSGPAVHSVHIYNDPAALISRLCGIVSSSLRIGDAALVIATAEHRDKLVKELLRSGVNLRSHAREGRYMMLDAREVLSAFMANGRPDPQRFETVVVKLLSEARRASRSPEQGLTVFGEMVAVLWDDGNKDGAFRLEELWNEALQQRAFHLHCAYPRWGFINGDEAAVCDMHSHVLQ